METTYAQLVLSLVIILALVVLSWLARKVYTPYGELRILTREVHTLKLDQADLFDRFGAWQKRDGMRQARAGKEGDGNLKAELEKLALAKQVAQPTSTRSALRAKFRGQNQ